MPRAIPETASMEPIAGKVLDHVPEGVGSVKVTFDPAHTLALNGLMAAGIALTVTSTAADVQPPSENTIGAMPAEIPITTPPVTEAVAGLKDDHEPLPNASVSVVVLPSHTVSVPVGAGGGGTTFIVVATAHEVEGMV